MTGTTQVQVEQGTDMAEAEMDAVRHWCILRTRAANTMALAESLGRAGYTAWTPIETISRQLPRKRVRVERRVPFAPTYVFADASRLADLAQLAAAPMKDHVDFSVFRYSGKFVFIADRHLDALRHVEDRASRRARRHRKAEPIAVGAKVRATSGIAQGLSGVVERSNGKITLVCFLGSTHSFEVSTSILQLVDIETGATPTGSTA